MGKDKTVAAAPVATAVKDSEDSVMDEIKGKNIMPTNLAKEVQDDIAKEEKDKKKSQLKRAIQHATSLHAGATRRAQTASSHSRSGRAGCRRSAACYERKQCS